MNRDCATPPGAFPAFISPTGAAATQLNSAVINLDFNYAASQNPNSNITELTEALRSDGPRWSSNFSLPRRSRTHPLPGAVQAPLPQPGLRDAGVARGCNTQTRDTRREPAPEGRGPYG